MVKVKLEFATIALFLFLVSRECDAKDRSFQLGNDSFLKDGEPFRILGGEMHYFRIVPQYWQDRLLRAKSMGLNTVQTYVPWNAHEPSAGAFDFGGFLDLEAYIKLAQALDLLVMLRIGPYVCGEWDFGGFPPWLLSKRPPLKLRTSDAAYLQLVDDWWNVLLPKIYPLLYSQNGPVIMVQIENEFGSYGSDKAYLHHLTMEARKHLGHDIILYTTDGATKDALSRGTNIEDNVYAAVDFPTGWDPVAAFDLQRRYNSPGRSPALSAEFYTGWLTHWGESLAQTSPSSTAHELHRLLASNASVVLYMAHGGTNFGFYSGANTGSEGSADYQPDITSYDYDAPIGEAGDLTVKYYDLRNVFAKYTSTFSPPAVPKRSAYGKVTVQKLASLFDSLDILSCGLQLDVPVAMELLNQTSGFIAYTSVLPSHAKAGSVLCIEQVHDRAQVFIGVTRATLTHVGTLERWSDSSLVLPSGTASGMQLWILVENMGRVNYGAYIYDPKGILASVVLDSTPITGWTAYPLGLTNIWPKLHHMNPSSKQQHSGGPAFYSGVFHVSSPDDTFLSFKGWSKGVAFINGFNLGRFWPSSGPQCTLYVPGPLLQPGENTMVILELEMTWPEQGVVQSVLEHDWTCSKQNKSH